MLLCYNKRSEHMQAYLQYAIGAGDHEHDFVHDIRLILGNDSEELYEDFTY
jgi:hypothetical protein